MLTATAIAVSPYIIGTAVGATGFYVAENQAQIDESYKKTTARVASMIGGMRSDHNFPILLCLSCAEAEHLECRRRRKRPASLVQSRGHARHAEESLHRQVVCCGPHICACKGEACDMEARLRHPEK
jgi:hypothetical protein